MIPGVFCCGIYFTSFKFYFNKNAQELMRTDIDLFKFVKAAYRGSSFQSVISISNFVDFQTCSSYYQDIIRSIF